MGSYDALFTDASVASLQALRAALLPATLDYLHAQIPFYRQRDGELLTQVRAPQELARLPLLTKDDAIAYQEALVPKGARAFVGIISSGTTHGDRRPLRVPRPAEEAQALREYEQARARVARPQGPAPAQRAPVRHGLRLEVRSMQHGLPETGAPDGLIRIPWTFTANALRLFEELISRPQPDGRWVTGVVIGSGALMPITAHLLHREVDFSAFQVKEIGTTGFRLSPHWRRVVESAWRATLYDNYSLSEFSTPAFECKACGFNHWQSPPLIAEVVDAFTREPLQEGIGVLVLTGLYPFVQGLPLLRYWTGDLVELGPPCGPEGERGVRCLGRLSQALVRPGRSHPVLVAPQDVYDFLDGRPEVARQPHPCETLGLVRSSEIGIVKYDLELLQGPTLTPQVTVELRFDPRIFPEAGRRLGEELAAFLLARSPALRELEETKAGELRLHLVGPGQLQKRWSKF